MGTWLVAKEDLTPLQRRLVEMNINEPRLISGISGSGKTQVLLHRARYLYDRLKVLPHRCLIFVPTNALKAYLQPALQLLNLPEKSLSTLDDWCVNFYRTHVDPKLPETNFRQLDFGLIRKTVRGKLSKASAANGSVLDNLFNIVFNLVQTEPISLPCYDFLLVDEGQELDEDALEIICLIARHVTILADSSGSVRGSRLSLNAISKRLEQQSAYNLAAGLRCSSYIASLAAQFIEDPQLHNSYSQSYSPTGQTSQKEKETPVFYYAQDSREQAQRIAQVSQSRLIKGESIAILLPLQFHVEELAKIWHDANYIYRIDFIDNHVQNLVYQLAELVGCLKEHKLDIQPIAGEILNNSLHLQKAWTNDYPKVVSFANCVGISFDTVIIPYLTINFCTLEPSYLARLLFTAITRAKKWVFLSTIKGEVLPLLEKILPLRAQGSLTVQNYSTTIQATTVPYAPVYEDEDDELIDIL